MFTNNYSLGRLVEFLHDLEAADDPNRDCDCFSTILSRENTGYFLLWILQESSWAPNAIIEEGFADDPRTATGTSPLNPWANAEYFKLRSANGKRILLVGYARPVGSKNGLSENTATYTFEYNPKKEDWEITHAYLGY